MKDKLKKLSVKEFQDLMGKCFDTRHVIFKTYQVNELLICQHIDKLNTRCWIEISLNQQLSESFIEKYADKLHWLWISERQKLSETFIEKHKDKVIWNFVSRFQKVSVLFILKHFDKINFHQLKLNDKINQEELNEFGIDVMVNLS